MPNRVGELFTYLDFLSPFATSEKWDNSGLQVGNLDDSFEEIYLSLDVDSEVLDLLPPHSLLITHHPLIFTPLRTVDSHSLIATALRKNITIIAMHTNYDKSHLNRYVLERVLGFLPTGGSEFALDFEPKMPTELFVKRLKKSLEFEDIRLINPKEFIATASLCTGSGASMLESIATDCFLTGDIKYHDAMKAMERNLMMIDIGHYESERYFGDSMAENLKFKGIFAKIANSKNPFTY